MVTNYAQSTRCVLHVHKLFSMYTTNTPFYTKYTHKYTTYIPCTQSMLEVHDVYFMYTHCAQSTQCILHVYKLCSKYTMYTIDMCVTAQTNL